MAVHCTELRSVFPLAKLYFVVHHFAWPAATEVHPTVTLSLGRPESVNVEAPAAESQPTARKRWMLTATGKE